MHPAPSKGAGLEEVERRGAADLEMLARITAPVAVIFGANEPPDWVRLSQELVAHVSCANYPAMHAALFGRLAAMLQR